MGGDLLDAEEKRQRQFIKGRLDAMGCCGYTVVGDGASLQGIPMENYYIQTAESGPLYITSSDCSKQIEESLAKDGGAFIADGFITVIKDPGGLIEGEEEQEYNARQCVQVVSDGASNNKTAWGIIQKRFPWVFCSWCVPHIINCFFRDCYKIEGIKELVDDAHKVNSWFRTHQSVAAIYRKYSRERYDGKEFALIQPADTRFGLYFVMIHRQIRVKDALEDTVRSLEYKQLKILQHLMRLWLLSWTRIIIGVSCEFSAEVHVASYAASTDWRL